VPDHSISRSGSGQRELRHCSRRVAGFRPGRGKISVDLAFEQVLRRG
jgi:hypothetical protein